MAAKHAGLGPDAPRWSVIASSEEGTAAYARQIASMVGPGDLVTLSGGLGAGKTSFARALIRTLTGQPHLDVPSPTFTLMQVYDGPGYQIVHADLYRVTDETELEELGWQEITQSSLVLLEWPERAPSAIHANRLDVELTPLPDPENQRRAITFTGLGTFSERVRRARGLTQLIESAGFARATRNMIQGDASSRSYERLQLGEKSAIAINAVPPKHGPAIRMGKTYRQLARLSDHVDSFIAISHGLIDQGLSAPEIYAADVADDLLIVEDFGTEGIVGPQGPIFERYQVAVEALVRLHTTDLPSEIQIGSDYSYPLLNFSLEPMLVEVELFLDWYMAQRLGVRVTTPMRTDFLSAWRPLEAITQSARTWTLRDYHSPNLFWLPHRVGVRRIGIIDFQDAVMGHPAYDLASLLQDARQVISEEFEMRLFEHYIRLRMAADPHFDLSSFAEAYAVLAAQRVTKILGIFVRLEKRDGKAQYLKHLPQLRTYLKRDLAHPSLVLLKAWFERNCPSLLAADAPIGGQM
jgi:tRNA threonylcarbamoyl adenosine modification protein YjeE